MLNMTNQSDGSVSPRELFTGRRTDFSVDLFGEYLQTFTPETNNSLEERTSGCIGLLPTGNSNGSVYCYHIATKRVIIRDKWVSIPVPTNVIDYLNDLALFELGKSKLPSRDPVFTYKGKVMSDSSPPFEGGDNLLVPREDEYRDIRNVERIEQHQFEMEPMMFWSPPLGEGRVVTLIEGGESDLEDLVTPPVPPDSDPSERPVSPADDPDDDGPSASNPPDTNVPLILPTRTRQKVHPNPKYFHIDNISIDDALLESPDLAANAISEELQQMIDTEVFEPMPPETVKDLGKIITCKMFLKKKFNTDGQLTRWKGRLVAGGHQQSRSSSSPSENSSPTAHINTVFLVALIAARQRRHTATCDIKGAYLHARMTHAPWPSFVPDADQY